MPYNNQPFPASDDSRASLFIFDSMVIYLCSHSSFKCMWFHLILRDVDAIHLTSLWLIHVNMLFQCTS